MSEPIFDPKWIKTHTQPLWKFKLLEFFGLAKYRMAIDPASMGEDFTAICAKKNGGFE